MILRSQILILRFIAVIIFPFNLSRVIFYRAAKKIVGNNRNSIKFYSLATVRVISCLFCCVLRVNIPLSLGKHLCLLTPAK